MDTEAAAALGDVDDPGDEVGYLLDECCELVDDDHEGRRRLLGVAIEGTWPDAPASAGAPARPFRAVIVGDGDFASNSFFPYMSNSELALSMVRWLAREDRAPRIRAGVPPPPLILLTGQQMKTIFLLLEVLLPLSVIAVGTGVWWRRR